MHLKIIAILFPALLSTSLFSQSSLEIKKSDNWEVVSILNNVELIKENREGNIIVRIYTKANGAGSAGFPSGEVTHNLLIAVSEFGEVPDQNLFVIGPLYSPKFSKWLQTNGDQKEFIIEYGPNDDMKKIHLVINIDALKRK